jgi:hypothetical protein
MNVDKLTEDDLKMGLQATRHELLRTRGKLAGTIDVLKLYQGRLLTRETAHAIDKEYINKLETYLWEELYMKTPHRNIKKEIYETLRTDYKEGMASLGKGS